MTATCSFSDIDEHGLALLAQLIALKVAPGEAIALSGDLGAGKTTFARAFVRAVLDDVEAEVPSPTFTLVQSYEGQRFPLGHFDLYRLSSDDDLAELGLDDVLARGVAVVEWPDRARNWFPPSRLDVLLRDGARSDVRDVRLTAHGAWLSKLARIEGIVAFSPALLGQTARPAGRIGYLQGDASPRAYARVAYSHTTSILMDAPRMPDGPPIRNGLPYSRIARLAEDVRPFVAIGTALRVRGLAAPRIDALDLDAGLLLLEDLGDRTFGRAIAEGYAQADLWRAAVEALVALRQTGPPGPLPLPGGGVYTLPAYDRDALAIETELLLDWYWRAMVGSPAPKSAWDDFRGLWNAEFDGLLQMPQGWVLRDYHSPNLMWMPERQGVGRVGVLDFQDALAGPWAFDLMSLLQDARVDVPAALEAKLLEHYCGLVAAIEPDFDRTSFVHAYSVLGVQRNTKILGIFARLAMRDGKPAYLQHMPRIWRYLERNLDQPPLVPLKAWYDHHFPPPMRNRVPSL